MSLIQILNAIKLQTQQVRSITEHLDFIKNTSKQFDETVILIDALVRNNRKSFKSISLFKDKKKLSDAADSAQREIELLNSQIEQLSIISGKIKMLNEKVNELFKVFFGDET